MKLVLLILAVLALYKIARDMYANFNPPHIVGLTPLGMLSASYLGGYIFMAWKLGCLG